MLVSTRLVGTVLLFVFGLVAYANWSSDRIPDWDSYRNIYENDGAWLKGRTESWVWLFSMNAFKALSPLPSYEAFRWTLFATFTAFIIFFLKGKVIAYPRDRYWFVLAALLVLSSLRFTAQIREGAVVALFLLSIGMLQRSNFYSLQKTRNSNQHAYLWAFFSWMVGIICIGLHLSGLALFVVRIFSYILSRISHPSRRFIFSLVWLALLLIIFWVMLEDRLIAELVSLALSRSGTRDGTAGYFTAISLTYWLVNIAFWFAINIMRSRLLFCDYFAPVQIKQIFSIISGPMAAICLISIVSFKSFGVQPVVTVLFVRTFDLAIGLIILYISLFSKSKLALSAALLFMGIKSVFQFIEFE